MKVDKTDIKIIKELKEGRKPFKLIADKLSITENTVRARVKKLTDAGILEISSCVNPEKIPDHTVIIIGIKLNSMNLIKKGEELKKLKGVVSVGIVTGRYDLILTALLNKDFGLLEFLTEELSKISDIQTTETFVVYHGFNLKVPLIV